MNNTERLMCRILERGRDEFGVVSVKAEFEAEGTRMDELLRLIDMARSVGLPMTVKIGGCEAIRDLLEAKQIGVRHIVAPMIETSYALSKFIDAKNLVYDEDEAIDTDFLFNLETATGFTNREEMSILASAPSGVQGVVFGRVDYSGSLGIGRAEINSQQVTDSVLEVAQLCLKQELDLVVGGGVSIDSLTALKEIAAVKLTRFETRKVVFSGRALEKDNISAGLLNAVHFELLWLTNKRDYYGRISNEDATRIEMLENRWNLLGGEIR
jgi:hypothetical protein